MGVCLLATNELLAQQSPLDNVRSLFKPEFAYLRTAELLASVQDGHIRVGDVLRGSFAIDHTIHESSQAPRHLPLGAATHALEQLGVFAIRGVKGLSSLEISLQSVGDITYRSQISRLNADCTTTTPVAGSLTVKEIKPVGDEITVRADCSFDNDFAQVNGACALCFKDISYLLKPIGARDGATLASACVTPDDAFHPDIASVRSMYKPRFAAITGAHIEYGQSKSKIEEGYCQGSFVIDESCYAFKPSQVTQGMAADMLEQLGMFAFTGAVHENLLPLKNPQEYALSLLRKERVRVSSIRGLTSHADLDATKPIYGSIFIARAAVSKQFMLARAKLGLDHDPAVLHAWSYGRDAQPAVSVKEATYVLDYAETGQGVNFEHRSAN